MNLISSHPMATFFTSIFLFELLCLWVVFRMAKNAPLMPDDYEVFCAPRFSTSPALEGPTAPCDPCGNQKSVLVQSERDRLIELFRDMSVLRRDYEAKGMMTLANDIMIQQQEIIIQLEAMA